MQHKYFIILFLLRSTKEISKPEQLLCGSSVQIFVANFPAVAFTKDYFISWEPCRHPPEKASCNLKVLYFR